MAAALITGATLGLINLPHCAGMCGPLVTASCGQQRTTGPVRYQVGRTLSYASAGALAGHIGEGLALTAPGRLGSWLFATLTAIACLLTARSLLASGQRLVRLRTAPAARSPIAMLWRLVPRDPLLLGLVSVFLPCGLLAAALFAAMATGNGQDGALLMLGFVTTSAASLLGAGWLIQRVPARASLPLRRVFATLLLLTAVVTIARPLRSELMVSPANDHMTHHCH